MMLVGGNYTVNPEFSLEGLDTTEVSSGAFSDTTQYTFAPNTLAVAKEVFDQLPSVSAFQLGRSAVLDVMEDEGIITQDEIKKRAESQFYAQFINIGDDTITEREYQELYQRKRDIQIRKSIMGRAPQTLGQSAQNLGIMLGVGLLDPSNIALGFLPGAVMRTGFAATRLPTLTAAVTGYNAKLAVSSSLIGRATLRAGGGAVAGATGAAIVEPLIYAAAQDRYEQYGITDVLQSILFGAALGGIMHVVPGTAIDVMTKRYKKPAPTTPDDPASTTGRTDSMTMDEVKVAVAAIVEDADGYNASKAMLQSFDDNGRRSLMRASLSSVFEDKHINNDVLIKMIQQEKWAQTYKREDVDLMYRDVINDRIGEATAMQAQTRINAGVKATFVDATKALKSEVAVLEKAFDARFKKEAKPLQEKIFELERFTETTMAQEIAALKKENIALKDMQAPKKGASKKRHETYNNRVAIVKANKSRIKAVRAKLKEELDAKKIELEIMRARQRVEVDVKKAELEIVRAKQKTLVNEARTAQELLKNLKENNLDEVPREMVDMINAEVAKRVDIVDAVHASKQPNLAPRLSQTTLAVRDGMLGIQKQIDAPDSRRSYSPKAEAEVKERGTPLSPDGLADKTQQLADAKETALATGEKYGVEYEMDDGMKAAIKDIETEKAARESLALCMSKAL